MVSVGTSHSEAVVRPPSQDSTPVDACVVGIRGGDSRRCFAFSSGVLHTSSMSASSVRTSSMYLRVAGGRDVKIFVEHGQASTVNAIGWEESAQ